MDTPFVFFRKLTLNESGVTAIEYALLGALIAVTCLGAFVALGSSVTGLYATLITLAQALLN